jgi:hypothetical protein
MPVAERSSHHVESKDSDTESESDTEEKGYLLENDWEITVHRQYFNGKQTHTVEEAGNTTGTDAVSGGTEVQAKKAKITMTERQQTFLTAVSLLCPKSVTLDHGKWI